MEMVKYWLRKSWTNLRWGARMLWLMFFYTTDRLIDAAGEYIGIIKKESELFLGAALLTLGLFSFEADKFCDGNSTNYLSCTRPTTYYYFDALDIFLIIAGVFFLLFWFLRAGSRSRGT